MSTTGEPVSLEPDIEPLFLAPDAFPFGVTSALTAEDPVMPMRIPACGGDAITDIASIGHPNARGAQAYADAITAVSPAPGL